MAKSRITSTDLKKLEPGKFITADGLRVDRINSREYRFTLDKQYRKQTIHEVVGHASTGMTPDKAYTLIDDRKRLIDQGLNLNPRQQKYPKPFDEATKEYLSLLTVSGGKDLKTKTFRLRTLAEYFQKKPLAQIKPHHADEYSQWRREQGRTDGTIKLELRALSHLFTMAVEWGWVNTKPKFRMPTLDNRRTVFFTDQQVANVLEQANAYPDPQIHTFCLIGFETGMRLKEILSLRVQDVDLERDRLFVSKGKTGSRHVPLSPTLKDHLLQVLNPGQTGPSWLFPSNKTASGHREGVRKAWQTIVKSAGLDPSLYIRHTMRHTVTTQLFDNGADMATVSAVTGHKSASMLLRYAHERQQRSLEAVAKLSQRRKTQEG
jgi:integrase